MAWKSKGMGKISTFNTLLIGKGLDYVLGEVETTHTDLMKATETFFTALYHQPLGTPIEDASFTLFTSEKKKPKIMASHPTSGKLLLHILHHPLWVGLAVAQGAPTPPELVDVIKCHCKAQVKQCSSETRSCHKEHLACTSCCNCSGGEN